MSAGWTPEDSRAFAGYAVTEVTPDDLGAFLQEVLNLLEAGADRFGFDHRLSMLIDGTLAALEERPQ